jgi:hypothetical protein
MNQASFDNLKKGDVVTTSDGKVARVELTGFRHYITMEPTVKLKGEKGTYTKNDLR